jgi:hypothetical protein
MKDDLIGLAETRTVRDRLAAWPNDAWDQDFRDFIDNEVLPALASLSTVLGVEK